MKDEKPAELQIKYGTDLDIYVHLKNEIINLIITWDILEI